MKTQIMLLKTKFNYDFFNITLKKHIYSPNFLHWNFKTTRYTNRETTAMQPSQNHMEHDSSEM